jgi:hypothetical protein
MPRPAAVACTKLFPSDDDWERFKRSYVEEPPPSLCWRWIGPMTGTYPRFQFEGRGMNAGRFAYRADPKCRPIPLDRPMLRRRCKNRLCVNPAHLDPVDDFDNAYLGLSPTAENVRKRFCREGHELTEENTLVEIRSGHRRRRCRACRRAKQAESERRRLMCVPCRYCGQLCMTGQCRRCLAAQGKARATERHAARAIVKAVNAKRKAESKLFCTEHAMPRVPDMRGGLRCPECWRVSNKKKAEQLDPNRYKVRKERGLCVTCGRPRGERPYRCDACHEKHNKASQASRRARVLSFARSE